MSAESRGQTVDFTLPDTDTQGCLGNFGDLKKAEGGGIQEFWKKSVHPVRLCQNHPVGSGADVDAGDDDPHWGRGAGEAPLPPAAAKSGALSRNNHYKASRSFLSTPFPIPGT